MRAQLLAPASRVLQSSSLTRQVQPERLFEHAPRRAAEWPLAGNAEGLLAGHIVHEPADPERVVPERVASEAVGHAHVVLVRAGLAWVPYVAALRAAHSVAAGPRGRVAALSAQVELVVAAHKLAQVDAGPRVAPLPDRLAERRLFAVQGAAKEPEQGWALVIQRVLAAFAYQVSTEQPSVSDLLVLVRSFFFPHNKVADRYGC